jgi:putative transposase
MFRRRPSRLPGFDYTGFHRYHLRFATAGRARLFTAANVVMTCCEQLLRTCEDEQFELLAYCFMPDHLHVMLQGAAADADLRRCARAAKQRIGFNLHRDYGLRRVWQLGYFERVLRDDEPTEVVIRYILSNPVRSGLVQRAEEYPFSSALFWPDYQ